jgi:hypothetical protein
MSDELLPQALEPCDTCRPLLSPGSSVGFPELEQSAQTCQLCTIVLEQAWRKGVKPGSHSCAKRTALEIIVETGAYPFLELTVCSLRPLFTRSLLII